MNQVLIAHQSTIPHYRVPFYNMLERLRPGTLRFDVVFDPSEVKSRRFFQEPLDIRAFHFPTIEVDTYSLTVSNKSLCYQTFWRRAAAYDLVVVENAVNNLTYPLCHCHKLHGTKIAYWGHGKDCSVTDLSLPKLLMERLKLLLVRMADGFFAYTPGVKAYLERQRVSPHKIFVVNNTIDINEQRRAFDRRRLSRTAIRQQLGIQGRNVLLFVGRFTSNKRIDFLLESFAELCKIDSGYHLLLVGSGGETCLARYASASVSGHISYLGTVVDLEELAPIYVASDVLAFPGSVGLGPLQALCYDLPVITIDSPTHMP